MTRLVKVWDLPVRLFHWSLVLLVVASFATGKLAGNWLEWHFRSGYCILALVLFRVAWGLAGSQTARFSDFVHGPARVLAYSRSLLGGRTPFHAGHNPMGGLMIVLMLVLLLVQATTGLFADDDIAARGPLADKASGAIVSLFTTVHRININVILACVALHICAALFYLVVKKDNLIGPMITGSKPVPDDHPAPSLTSPARAAIVLAAVAAFVVWLVKFYPR
ncbi:MAG: cytochrome b/b6 domain-containing protein [Betaproteobacteria bacterium]|nr:cytochrome b/b6 domain-containing protein [Betaproteobacteria bacterium]